MPNYWANLKKMGKGINVCKFSHTLYQYNHFEISYICNRLVFIYLQPIDRGNQFSS